MPPVSRHGSRYSRPAPSLPDPKTLSFLARQVRACNSCGLRAGCTAPVPGENVVAGVGVLLLGQNPGVNEDLQGRPFVGQAGQYLDSLLFQARIAREDTAICNLVKCLTPGNRAPTRAEVAACAGWLDLELDIVNPYVIVTMGLPATYHVLGGGAGSMEQLHGRPILLNGRIILPVYHPAAALRDTSKLRQCAEDFQALRRLMDGAPWRSFYTRDEYPSPDYRVADSPALIKTMMDEAAEAGVFGLDTELCRGKLWSYQVSSRPGTGWFVPIGDDFQGRVDFTGRPATAVVHNYLHDIQYVGLRDDGFVDTMVMAYICGQPQGLKELASRLCGIKMVSYGEMVKPGQQELSLEYMMKVLAREWPDPPLQTVTGWNNKKGEMVTRQTKPWNIRRKAGGMIKDFEASPDTDLWDRWRHIPSAERALVEEVLGPMPEASLSDIPFEQAVAYAVRDADATLRVYLKLERMVEKLGLEFALLTDLRILPMVDAMMRNGMAVDVEYYRSLSESYDQRLRVMAASLAKTVGHAFNPASSQQSAAVVYGELGFTPTRRTATGLISTDDAELKKTGHAVAAEIVRYRGLLKLKSTYADNVARSARPDATGVPRMHTVLKTTRVETGRLSSSKADDGTGANLQNIPTRSKEARAIKNGFIAPPGWVLADGDLGQIELVTQAHLANCGGLIELFNRGGDPHTETAARLFGVSLEEAAKDKYRYPCKRAGFGIIYMIGAEGLSTQVNEYIADLRMEGEPVDIEPWDKETCATFIEEYYRLYPEIREYQHRELMHARRHGYVQDMFGRIRYVPEVLCPVKAIQEAGARMAANFAVTASAAGIIKLAMGELWEKLPGTEWADVVRWLMQVHDSLVVEVIDDEDVLTSCLSWMSGVMRGVVCLSVPIKVDFKVGRRWGELEKIKFT